MQAPKLKETAERLRAEVEECKARKEEAEAAVKQAAVAARVWAGEVETMEARAAVAEAGWVKAREDGVALRFELEEARTRLAELTAESERRQQQQERARQQLQAELEATAAELAKAREARAEAARQCGTAEAKQAALKAEVEQRDEARHRPPLSYYTPDSSPPPGPCMTHHTLPTLAKSATPPPHFITPLDTLAPPLATAALHS